MVSDHEYVIILKQEICGGFLSFLYIFQGPLFKSPWADQENWDYKYIWKKCIYRMRTQISQMSLDGYVNFHLD